MIEYTWHEDKGERLFVGNRGQQEAVGVGTRRTVEGDYE